MSDTMKLFYAHPAASWDEVLPLGNGHLGAMVWGGDKREQLGLNEGTLWSGYPRDKNNPDALVALAKVRELVFQGKYSKAQELLEEKMLGEFTESYMPMGNLFVETGDGGEATQYVRELNLGDACARITYTQNATDYRREYFVSYPHRALILRFDASQRTLDLTFRFESLLKCSVSAEEGILRIVGLCPEHVDPNYTDTPEPVVWGSRGIRFEAALQVLETDGDMENGRGCFSLRGGSYAVLAFTAVKNPDLTAVYEQLGYAGLKRAHIDDYQALFNRTELSLGTQPEIPTDERLKRFQAGEEDPGLFALYFQYGRYLMISGSRKGGMPMNLQGLWNWEIRPPWSSNYTTNINTQMNYWPALSCGLAECMEPYFRFLERIAGQGKRTATMYFGCRGFTLHHNTDRWASTNPVGAVHGHREGMQDSARYAYFPLGGAWMCQELWRFYEYTGNIDFLTRTAYPLLREATLFCLDFLVEHNGHWVICPSASPENAFATPDGGSASVSYACTMDMTIVRETFDHFEKTCRALGREDDLLADVAAKKAKLFPYRIGQYGQLQEWCEDFDETEPGHRHLSHLYGLFPSELFAGDSVLMDACQKAIERRLSYGGGHTGWSCAWLINLLAVLGDGEGAYRQLHTLLARSTYPNLWDGHPPFQIDGNFGGIAGIANLLVQDRGGEVKLLPALPKAFSNGFVRGLRIKGGKAVDLRWQEGKLVQQRIYPAEE